MNLRSLGPALTTAALLGLTATALAGASLYGVKRASTHPAGVSGIKGTIEASIGGKGGAGSDVWYEYGLHGVQVTMKDGKPCSVAPLRRYFDAARTTNVGDPTTHAIGSCEGTITGLSSGTVSLPNQNWFARGIKVCTAQNPGTDLDGIAGIKLWAAKVDKDNTWSAVEDPEVWKSPACATWHDKKMCDHGEVAIGFNAHHNDKVYRGMSLVCGKPRRLP